jgi:hypothetical protein
VDTVTVSFAPTNHSQAELREELGRVVETLVDEGVAKEARVETIFPGNLDARWKGAFLVRFRGSVARVVEALKAVPGIQSAQASPTRHTY